MSYTTQCLVVQRTAANQQNLVEGGGFLSPHDRLGTVSGCWKLDADRAASCSYLLVATDGVIVDVARILGAERVPERWTVPNDRDESEGLSVIDPKRVAVITAPNVPEKIETIIGQPVATGRNPIAYVDVVVNGTATIVESGQDDTAWPERLDRYIDAAGEVLREVARDAGTITYGDLAERLETLTALTENRPMHWWIGEVLAAIAGANAKAGEPFLTSLVVRADSGKVGGGYAGMVSEHLADDEVGDPDEHAAVQRLRVYRQYGGATAT